PSLLFLMMTLGPALMLLAAWDGLNRRTDTLPNAVSRALITYGRVPLFFYLLQWPVAHGMGYLLSLIAGKDTWIFFRAPGPGPSLPLDAGFNLGVTYAAWIAGVLLLYPVCKWYASIKSRRSDWWLSYL
ncbi:MAG TPA: hypothetical protein VHM24_09415, partial [Gemmatimonadaceae bacterium]|nr:hypothetical protein [Gemmatimonadaceae bacterium]